MSAEHAPGRRSVRFVHLGKTRRFTRRTARPQEWVGLHAAALAREPAVRAAFATALRAAQDAVDPALVRVAIERYDAGSAVAAFPWAVFQHALGAGVLEALRDVTGAAAVHTARALDQQLVGKALPPPPEGSLLAMLRLRNPRLESWIASHAAKLVRDVTIETQFALREIVLDAARRGTDIRSEAARIAEVLQRGVGLTQRQARALLNLGDHLNSQGLAPSRVNEVLAIRRDRMIVQRSKMIARTETMIAAGAGQQEAWLQARETGLLDDRQTRRRWLAQPAVNDANPCPICAGLNDQLRGLTELFVSTYDGTTVMQPPAHPGCLCTTVLTFAEAA